MGDKIQTSGVVNKAWPILIFGADADTDIREWTLISRPMNVSGPWYYTDFSPCMLHKVILVCSYLSPFVYCITSRAKCVANVITVAVSQHFSTLLLFSFSKSRFKRNKNPAWQRITGNHILDYVWINLFCHSKTKSRNTSTIFSEHITTWLRKLT